MQPNYIILNIADIVCDLENQLEQSWLFTVDIEFVLENIFISFYDIASNENNFNITLQWFREFGFELKAENNNIQLEFVMEVIRQTMLNIYNNLVENGYLNNESFPYKFGRVLPDRSILVTRLSDT